MHHQTYPSLINTYREKELAVIREANRQQEADDWWVTEKIHGANFAFYYSLRENTLRYAGRSHFVDSSFYQCGPVVAQLEEPVRNLGKALQADHREVEQIIVFGELFGQGINKGVRYPAGRYFAAFDLWLSKADTPAPEGAMVPILLKTFDEKLDRIQAAGIHTVPVLFRGTLEEALAFAPAVRSQAGEKVATDFHSPEDNVAEGVTLRPNRDFPLHRGQPPYLKHKSKPFQEREERQRAPRKPKGPGPMEAHPALLEYVTENRLQSVLSKEGPIEGLIFGYVQQKLAEDACLEYLRDHDLHLEPADNKALRKALSRTKELRTLVQRAFGYVA